MYIGDTIQRLVAAVDTIHGRRSDDAVKPAFTNAPQIEECDHDRTSHLEANLIRASRGRD